MKCMFTGDYFQPLAEDVFGGTLMQLGSRRCPSRVLKGLETFARDLLSEGSGTYVLGTYGLTETLRANPRAYSRTVCFEAADWFVELFECPGEAHADSYDGNPCHYLHIHIGPLPERSAPDGMIAVDIEETLPPDSPLRENKILWRYKDMDEMEKVFIRARDEIFVPFAVPLLLDKSQFADFVERQAELRVAQHLEEIATHNAGVYHAKAERAYKAKDFRDYLSQIREIPAGRLTKVDMARIKFVLKRVQG